MHDYEVRIGPLEHAGVSVIRHPGATVFSLLTDVLGNKRQGVPRAWRRAVRDALPPAEAEGLRALLSSPGDWVPESLSLTQTLENVDMATVLEELDGLDLGRLTTEIETGFAGEPPPPWQRVVERPGAFVASYRRVVEAVWDGLAPLWSQADGLYGREMERLGVATVSGRLESVMNDLGSPVRFADGLLHLPCDLPQRRTAWTHRHRLVFVPLASGFTACMYSAERDDAIWIGYPLPGLGQIADPRRGAAPQPRDALALVLGPARAAILRNAGHGPSTSDLASRLGVGVSTVTYHCDHLVAAGLLRRERRGREVRLRRTERGTDLIDLLVAS